jgi:hypothetical protein
MRLQDSTIKAYVWDINANWRHVKAILDPAWRCPYCGFLNFGCTDIERLQAGVCVGWSRCNIVLEAVRAWHQHDARSLDGMHIFSWELGYNSANEESIGCSVLLRWSHEDNKEYPLTPSNDTIVNVFKSGMSLFSSFDIAGGPATERFAKARH